ncbi:MAG: glycosyltransferase family 2 protein [Nitratireductor sp.]|nr:glycosyltransferase family 2 protein [Nitratireductor sp.]
MEKNENARPAARFRIVVPTRNRPNDLARLLSALAPQLRRRRDFALVIVNDGSDSDAYRSVIAPYEDLLTYLASSENLGIGPARQLGLVDAQEEYVVTTDDDCIPGPLWLDRIAALADAHAGADIFAGFTDAVPSGGGRFFRAWSALPNTTPEVVTDPLGLVTAVTANAVFRREYFTSAAPLTLNLPYAPDDYHVTQAALRAGASFRVETRLRTGHILHPQFFDYLRRQYRYGLAAAEYAIVFNDRRLAGMLGDPSIARALARGREGMLRQWREARRTGFFERSVSALLGGLAAFSLQLGWLRGANRFGREHGKSIPGALSLGDQFSAFCLDVDLASNPPER